MNNIKLDLATLWQDVKAEYYNRVTTKYQNKAKQAQAKAKQCQGNSQRLQRNKNGGYYVSSTDGMLRLHKYSQRQLSK